MLWMPKGKCSNYEDDDTHTVHDKPQYEYFPCDVPFGPKNNHKKWVVSATSSSRKENLGAEGLSNCPDVVESRCQAIVTYVSSPCRYNGFCTLWGQSGLHLGASFYKNRKVPGECFPVFFALEGFTPSALRPRDPVPQFPQPTAVLQH